MSTPIFPAVTDTGAFVNPDVLARLDERYATAGGGLTQWTGARLELTADRTYTVTGTTAPMIWDTAARDTGGFVAATKPNGFTIPAGITRVRLAGAVQGSAADPVVNNQLYFRRTRAGTTDTVFAGNTATSIPAGYTNNGALVVSDVLDVQPGDYFEFTYFSGDSWVASRHRTWFGIEAVEQVAATAALAGLSDVSVTAPQPGHALVWDGATSRWVNRVPTVPTAANRAAFRGALIGTTAAKTGTGVLDPVTFWDVVDYDTDGFWSAAQPSRLTVPTGITKVRLTTTLAPTAGPVDGSNVNVAIRKNASTVRGAIFVGGEYGTLGAGWQQVTAVLPVVGGDYFEVRFNPGVTTSVTYDALSHFSIEVVESQ